MSLRQMSITNGKNCFVPFITQTVVLAKECAKYMFSLQRLQQCTVGYSRPSRQ